MRNRLQTNANASNASSASPTRQRGTFPVLPGLRFQRGSAMKEDKRTHQQIGRAPCTSSQAPTHTRKNIRTRSGCAQDQPASCWRTQSQQQSHAHKQANLQPWLQKQCVVGGACGCKQSVIMPFLHHRL